MLSANTTPTASTFTIAAALCLMGLLAAGSGCAASKSVGTSESDAAPTGHAASAPDRLERNHFRSDRTGNISEEKLRRVLDSPAILEERPRVGIVPVRSAYETDRDVPLSNVPEKLADTLEGTGFFEVTTEISTGWQRDSGVGGLRELAARYRSRYLLLYRHRFIERSHVNAWGWTYLTVVGAFAAPATTVEVEGVLEASLFDVRTGTIMFTVYERVERTERFNIWHQKHKRHELQEEMLGAGTEGLSKKVVDKVRHLVAARDEYEAKREASAAARSVGRRRDVAAREVVGESDERESDSGRVDASRGEDDASVGSDVDGRRVEDGADDGSEVAGDASASSSGVRMMAR
jgi:hypothetical protein